METKKGKIFYFDFIRVLAIFLVIFIHISAIDTVKNIGTGQWQITKFLNFFAHASVPLFFMISGALLLNSSKTKSLSYTWKKRIPRVVIPFVLWSILSTLAVAVYAHSFSLSNVLKMYAVFLYQPVSPTLWFMYPLIGLYVLSPLIRAMVENANTKLLWYITVVWLITNSLMPTLSYFLPKDISHALDFYPGASFTLMGGYIGYFILGYLLTKLDVHRINSWLLLLVMVVMTLLGNYFSIAFPKSNEGQSYVTSIFIVLMSISTYLLLQKWAEHIHAKSVKATFSILSPLVFGIYLIHNILILFLEPWFINHLPYQGLLATFTRYFAVAILAAIIIWVISLIPGINYLLTGKTRRKQ